MKKYFFIISILTILFLFNNNIIAEEAITPQKILQNADMTRAPKESFLIKTNVIQYKDGKETNRARIDVYVNAKKEYKSLARFILPRYNKNRVLLNTKEAIWLYIPGTKRVIRLSASQRLMGEASNADLLSVNFQEDYTAKLEGIEEKEGRKCYKLFLTAKSPSTAYASLRYWVTVEEFYPWVCEYHALSGKTLKIAHFKTYKELLGRLRPSVVEIKDAVRQTYKTIIIYNDMKYKDLPDKYFQKDYMAYIRW